MKYMKYVLMIALLAMPLAYAQAAVRVGVGIGVGGYVAGPPACAYGYYADYPYACAPYGYYGPDFFVNGVFIGAGPWYHGWGHPYYGGWGHGYYGRPYARGFEGRGFVGHGEAGRGFAGHGAVAGNRGGFHGGGFRGRR